MISSHKHRAKAAFKKAQPRPRPMLFVPGTDGYRQVKADGLGEPLASVDALRAARNPIVLIDEDDAQL